MVIANILSISSPQCAHESQGLEAVLVLENSEWCELMKCDMVLSRSYSQSVSVTDILGRPHTSFCNSPQSIWPLKHLHIAHIFILFCACVFVWYSCMSTSACVNVCALSSEGKMRSWLPLSTVHWTLPRQHVKQMPLLLTHLSDSRRAVGYQEENIPFLATRWSLCHRVI